MHRYNKKTNQEQTHDFKISRTAKHLLPERTNVRKKEKSEHIEQPKLKLTNNVSRIWPKMSC